MARTAGRAGWVLVGGLGALVVLQPGGCGSPGPGGMPPEVQDAMTATLEDAWPEVLAPTLERARAAADVLVEATGDWAADPGAADARSQAQEAWIELMDVWQELEVMQIGPAASSLMAVGGEDLRDEVYSWPTVSRCRVDQQTVAGGWGDPAFFEVNLVNAYGLDALETLLFSPEGVNDCPNQVDINASGSWAALGVDGVQARRADYASALSLHVQEVLELLAERWEPSGGDFAGKLANAGVSGPYETQERGINAIFDGLFYLETRTKDRKLGGPLGRWNCGAQSCLSEVESRLSGTSHLWIASNLRGFQALFTGGAGTGMEDLMRALGHEAVADQVLAELAEALAAAEALEIPIDEAVERGEPAAVTLYDELKDVTDLLKGDLATLLALQIPAEAAGDND